MSKKKKRTIEERVLSGGLKGVTAFLALIVFVAAMLTENEKIEARVRNALDQSAAMEAAEEAKEAPLLEPLTTPTQSRVVESVAIERSKVMVDYQAIIEAIRKESQEKSPDHKEVTVYLRQLKGFEAIGESQGVDWVVLVSQWYQESRCSTNMGDYRATDVLNKRGTQFKALEKICKPLGKKLDEVRCSKAGAVGPMQILPTIWLEYQRVMAEQSIEVVLNPWSLPQSIEVAAWFLKAEAGYNNPKARKERTLYGALGYYNAGHGGNKVYASEVWDRAETWRKTASI